MGGFNDFYNTDPGRSGPSSKRSSEGVLAPANWKGADKTTDGYGGRKGEIESEGPSGFSVDELRAGYENRVQNVKLKVGGVTLTIATSSGGSESGSLAKCSRPSDSSPSRYTVNKIGTLNCNSTVLVITIILALSSYNFTLALWIFCVPWLKDIKKEDQLSGKMAAKNVLGKHEDKAEPVRKSKRVPKKGVMDGDFDEDEDDELRYLEKLKNSKMNLAYGEDNEGSSKKRRKLASVSDLSTTKPTENVKKSRVDEGFEDIDYEEEEETGSDGEVEGKKKKSQKKEFVDSLMDSSEGEMTLTSRQRAMQSKDASASGTSAIEFPNGLPPARRQENEKRNFRKLNNC